MKKWQEKESIVFTGTEWSTLRYGAIDPHSVTLRYRTPWLRPGIAVSLATLAGLLAAALLRRKRKNP